MSNVFKKVLSNGLTVLVRPTKNIPKVSMQIWYNVGSKNESESEKGLAHLLEHMVFKGTDRLSESDIDRICSKMSGECNAFTSYDYTGYLFDMPSQHWKEALNLFADCMTNCSFKEEHLNSELKAVIQELKMYKDDYGSVLIEKMLNNIFPGFPYQHPVIGYKQDLWNLTRENLIKFYKKYYGPNNATLVAVGDIEPEEFFKEVEKEFGHIKPIAEIKKPVTILEKDLYGSDTAIYRDVQQPGLYLAFVVPGAHEAPDYIMDLLNIILAEGKSSRIYKRLVEEEQIASDVNSFSYDLFDHGLLFLQIEPNEVQDIQKCIDIIKEEVEKLKRDGFTDEELQKAQNLVESRFYNLLEHNQKQAYSIGKYYLALKDENYIFNYIEKDNKKIKEKLNALINDYLVTSLMHTGKVLPISPDDLKVWKKIQTESDELDSKILSKRIRTSDVEPGSFVNTLQAKEPKKFNFPKYTEFDLKNGLKVLSYENKNIPKVDLILDLKGKFYYDSIEGISNFVNEMLLEGTEKYKLEELSERLESLGIGLNISSGLIQMNVLTKNLEAALDILNQILMHAVFPQSSINKIKTHLKAQIKNFWDEPTYIADQLIKSKIYAQHPYSKNPFGTIENIEKITREDLIKHYKKYFTPVESKLSISGDFQGKNIEKLIEKYLGAWQGEKVEDLPMNLIEHNDNDEIYSINRDQVVLAFAGKSIDRLHPEFDNALVFDQIYGGGALGQMSSKLFKIREKTGLFYTISGSVISRADLQPGMSLVKTIVSLDRLEEAEKAITEAMHKSYNEITDEEIRLAKNALVNSRVDSFESNRQIASSFLFLKKYGFGPDYFDTRSEKIMNVKKDDVIETAQKILKKPMFKVKVGRI